MFFHCIWSLQRSWALSVNWSWKHHYQNELRWQRPKKNRVWGGKIHLTGLPLRWGDSVLGRHTRRTNKQSRTGWDTQTGSIQVPSITRCVWCVSHLLQVCFILLEASLISKWNHRAGCGLDWKRCALEQCGERNDTESGHRWEEQNDCPTRPVSAKQCCCWSKWEVQNETLYCSSGTKQFYSVKISTLK